MDNLENKDMVPLTDDELEEAAGGGFLTDAIRAMMGDVVDKTKTLLHIQMEGEEPREADDLLYVDGDPLRAQHLITLDTPDALRGNKLNRNKKQTFDL